MKRLNDENINTPDMSDGIFKNRWEGQEHDQDWNRFAALANRFTGGRYLDLGAFNSPMPGHLSEQFPDAEIIAIDHAPYAVEQMQKKYPKVKYICADFLTYPWTREDEESFDYIVSGEVIEHLEDPQAFIDGCYRLLKKGGTLAISTPFEETISRPLVSKEHLWAFTIEDIKKLFSKFKQNVYIEINREQTTHFFLAYGTK